MSRFDLFTPEEQCQIRHALQRSLKKAKIGYNAIQSSETTEYQKEQNEIKVNTLILLQQEIVNTRTNEIIL